MRLWTFEVSPAYDRPDPEYPDEDTTVVDVTLAGVPVWTDYEWWSDKSEEAVMQDFARYLKELS